jgi:DNA processing protein
VETTFDLLTLALVPGLTPRAACELVSRGPLADALSHPSDHADLVGQAAAGDLASGALRRAAEAELCAARRHGVELVGCDDSRYPQWLRRTHTPPLVLWVKGTLDRDEGARSLAIVGSRAASPLGHAFARRLAEDLAAAGIVVVSGLARGIDTAAHEGALFARGHTVAILGSALDRLYPPENASLAAAIAEAGALVSEFRFGTEPLAPNFPRRNRVLAAWSRAVVVVEAAARSGALITARYALDEGREVLAVPGHPSQRGAEGTNQLLKDGAALVRNAHDVAAELGLELAPAAASAAEGPPGLLARLRPDVPLSLDEICESGGESLPEILAELSRLEVERLVRRLPGALYLRASPERV